MVKNNHDLKSFACKEAVSRLILVDLELVGIPESYDINNPLVVSAAPVQEAVEIFIVPAIIDDAAQIIQKPQRIPK